MVEAEMEEENEDEVKWQILPTDLLQQIFAHLPVKNLGRCSQVCSNWFYTYHTDYPWRTFTFKDGIFVRRKFTQHSGWQYHIDHWRLRFLITNAARRWRILIIRPVTNLFNLYEFFRVLTNFSEYYERHTEEDRPLAMVRDFHFQWKLHVDEDETSGILQDKDIGTGGEMLHTLTSVMKHLHGLKSISLIDLQLTHWEADRFIVELLDKFSNQLTYLSLLNVTLHPKPFLQVGLFLNLRKLLVSPQMLDADTLSVISCLQNLDTFSIIQDEKSSAAPVCNRQAWKTFTAQSQGRIRVWLILRGKPKIHLIIQPNAPVYGIKMEMSSGQLTLETAEQIANFYSNTLCQFVQCGLERYKRGGKMNERVDLALFELCRRCLNLEVVSCRERISHGTAVMLAIFAQRNGFKLFLRQNGLLKRVCWCRTDVTEHEVDFDWLKQVCKSQEEVISTIQILTKQTWPVLDDKAFNSFCK
ncbi:unnamed protein product [Caenorhabditis angaria]|uniref:F-box domain-containing protein n=1 Tax=Caenorhabditis angaria TaxID=860376 RepID=A0A9P1J166_9PELO|nr:unnamed protein product [Caenorhabditis angaria]